MGCGRVCLFSTLVLTVILAVYLNEPVPPNTGNPYKYKILGAIVRTVNAVAQIRSWCTGEDSRISHYKVYKTFGFASRQTDPDVLVTEEEFNGIHVYIYKSRSERKDRPGLLYFYGGGFRIGHPVFQESLYGQLVKEIDLVVIGVQYRLAPTHIVPAAFEDAIKAAQFFFMNARAYGVNPDLIGAAGDSAGGNLAAALSLKLRDLGEKKVAFQVLINPWLQGLDFHTPSYVRNSEEVLMYMNMEAMTSYLGTYLGIPPELFPDLAANKHVTKETLDKYKKHLDIDAIPKKSFPSNYKKFEQKNVNKTLADLIVKDLTNPYNFPLMADDLTNLPPAFVLTVENDPIRDEGIWYAKRLNEAGNHVIHYNSEDGFHGMIAYQAPPLMFESAVKATMAIIEFVRKAVQDIDNSGH